MEVEDGIRLMHARVALIRLLALLVLVLHVWARRVPACPRLRVGVGSKVVLGAGANTEVPPRTLKTKGLYFARAHDVEKFFYLFPINIYIYASIQRGYLASFECLDTG